MIQTKTSNPSIGGVRARLRALANPARAAILARFFKTGPGEYGQGDKFLGITVPVTRRVAREFARLAFADTLKLLKSPWHEERLLALLLLVARMRHADQDDEERIYRAYLAHTDYINNWDLVDVSARDIVGPYLEKRARDVLDQLAASNSVWERRIAVLATFHFIRRRDFVDTLRLARKLLSDEHDLMHKAVGWMLREIGKRDRSVLEDFLHTHARSMPRTMLRYAIEHFPPARRRAYLAGVSLRTV
jgi:3-methyladenine DNA glycosylase AlkD